MKKLALITKIFLFLILGIGIGLICGVNNIQFPIKILATFSGLFSNFLSFVIPLIIIGFIVPGIASLGSKSGKGLIITTIIAYISTLLAGLLAYLIGSGLLPKLISGNVALSEGGQTVEPYFNIEIPAIMGVMSALVLAFVLGIGLSKIKNSAMLKVAEEFNQIVLMIVTNVLIPLVPIYIGSNLLKSSSFLLFLIALPIKIPGTILIIHTLTEYSGFTVNINMKNVAIKDNIEYLLSVNVPIIA